MSAPAVVCGSSPEDSTADLCPICKTAGKRVRPETLKGILREDRMPEILEGYSLCLSKECRVVYFGSQIFSKTDVNVKIWFKESDPDVPICYCKGVTKKDIIEHIAIRRCCNNIKDIQEHTGANTGKECFAKNPAGT